MGASADGTNSELWTDPAPKAAYLEGLALPGAAPGTCRRTVSTIRDIKLCLILSIFDASRLVLLLSPSPDIRNCLIWVCPMTYRLCFADERTGNPPSITPSMCKRFERPATVELYTVIEHSSNGGEPQSFPFLPAPAPFARILVISPVPCVRLIPLLTRPVGLRTCARTSAFL